MIKLFTEEEFNLSKSRDKLALKCKHCNKTFYKPKNQIMAILNGKYQGTGEFCSQRCNRQASNPPLDINCEQCEKVFKKWKYQILKSKHNFCSKSCSCTYQNLHKTKGIRISKLEKWLAEKLPLLYPDLEFHFNQKNTINSELDIYIPSLKLAFELNGIFHYEPIFSKEKLDKIQNNDQRKNQACLEQGIELCIIDVSKQKYFKEANCLPFLKIIQDIILLKIS